MDQSAPTVRIPNADARSCEQLIRTLNEPIEADEVVLDLSELTFIRPIHQALLPLWLYRQRESRPEFRISSLREPISKDTRGYARQCGLIAALRGEPAASQWESGVPLRVVFHQAEGSQAAEQLGDLVSRTTGQPAPYGYVDLYGEMIDNAVQHGEAQPFAALAAQHLPNQAVVEVVVADSGIGIADSFTSNGPSEGTEVIRAKRSALALATEAEQTSKPGRHTGLGLFLAIETIRENRGYLRIVSHAEELILDGRELTIRASEAPWHGTIVAMEIHSDRALGWDRANDMLDAPAPDRFARCVLGLRIYGRALVTRERGRAVRQDAATLRRRGRVTLDFAGVEAASPSFLDELLYTEPRSVEERSAIRDWQLQGQSEATSRTIAQLQRRRGLA